MKKSKFAIPILITIVVVVYICLRLAGVFQFYTIPTSANAPQIEPGSIVFSTNLLDPKIGNFVCFEFENEREGKHMRIYRLVGKSGDRIEIKDAILYINGENFDHGIDLQHQYLVPNETYTTLSRRQVISKEDYPYKLGSDYIVSLTDKVAIEYGVHDHMVKDSINQENSAIKSHWKKLWNRDNFGPLTIPSGKIFLLGDSRHAAEDSRYTGLVDESSIKGVALFK